MSPDIAQHTQATVLDIEEHPRHYGLLAFFGAGTSIAICYSKGIMAVTVGVIGLSVPEWNPHVQAVLMWVFGMIAVYGLVKDSPRHGSRLPIILGVLGVTVIILTIYTHYQASIEMSGYVLLLVAAFLNQTFLLGTLNDTVTRQARELDSLNNSLQRRVDDQVGEIERLSRLKRFLAPEVANLVTAEQEESLLKSHRSYIAAVSCDLRSFTTFSEETEPEEVVNVLQTYHERIGRLVAQARGTIDHRAGDGLMVFFNDPLPCDEPVLRAVRLALEMRLEFRSLNADWDRRGYGLGFGVGVASGYATLGTVGYEGRFDYTANGNAVNLAARLCDEAGDGEVLISHKALLEVEDAVAVEPKGALELKGFSRPVKVFNVVELNEPGDQS